MRKVPFVWPGEAAGALLALLIAIIVVSHLATSDRAELLYFDGDSMLNVLVSHSIAVSQPQDWAMSSVLFLPEIAVFAGLSLLGLSVMATLTLNAVVNLMALYASIRFVAFSSRVARRRGSRAPIAGSLLAFGAFGVLAMLESSGDRNSLELASLVTTTTYYSATIVGVLLTVGLMLRMLDAGGATKRAHVAILAAIAALSTLTNPLYVAWAVVPLGVVLFALAVCRRVPRAAARVSLLSLILGSLVGFVARLPLAGFIADSGANYVRPARWAASAQYYFDLLTARAQTPEGVAALALIGVLFVGSVGITVIALRRDLPALTFLAGVSWFVPLVTVFGAIAVGTEAARYLQPIVFMPVLALTALPSLLPQNITLWTRRHRVGMRVAAASVTVVVAGSVLLTVPRLHLSDDVRAQESSVACVVNWVNASGRIGAGEFWTVRAPKAYLDDTRQLVQVDYALNAYAWLVNRADFEPGAVSFLVTDRQSAPFVLPPGVSPDEATVIPCGRYTITDFGSTELPLGPTHS